ncbi:Uncharacterised protein [Mycobacteroides abscessus]|nr:Uncharacterised protein [Mycobacteroides abscessus]SHT71572.1 Uncharacterised protein [Mycobacteroides abscessus subsp. abscessus]
MRGSRRVPNSKTRAAAVSVTLGVLTSDLLRRSEYVQSPWPAIQWLTG